MPFVKGKPKTGGRKPGVQNAINQSVKDVVMTTFQLLQDDPNNNLTAFAKKYPREFYQIAAKLIPTAINADLTTNGKDMHWTVEIVKPKR